MLNFGQKSVTGNSICRSCEVFLLPFWVSSSIWVILSVYWAVNPRTLGGELKITLLIELNWKKAEGFKENYWHKKIQGLSNEVAVRICMIQFCIWILVHFFMFLVFSSLCWCSCWLTAKIDVCTYHAHDICTSITTNTMLMTYGSVSAGREKLPFNVCFF